MIKWIFAVLTAAALGSLSYWNYRRFMPKPRPLTSDGRGNRVTIRPLSIPAAHTLYGELLLPQGGSGPFPTVICCHGFGSSYRLCRDTMGMCLAMSGFAVFCFDFYGGSRHSRSGGTMLDMSIFTEREDLDAIISAVSDLPEVDADNLFLLGESQGGCVCGITAPRHLSRLRAMVLYYPAFCIPDDARRKFASPAEIPPVSKTFGLKVSRLYNERLLDYDIWSELSAFTKPVLILHGDGDTVVNISYGKKASECYPDARLHIFSGEPHGFTGKGKLRAAQETYNFLKNIMSQNTQS
ncbi:MAG: alpha/beta fold hydrolase [Eubacteriales bacterium]|nr:alpha/beta fold hydrolase [Eubacteriales bacterium]